MAKTFLTFLILTLGAVLAQGFDLDESPKIGFELYSWQSKGTWRYAVMEGTTTVHSASVIQAPRTRLKNITYLKGRLATLQPGETVYWRHQAARGFGLPSKEIVEDLRRYADGLQIKLILPDEIPKPPTPAPPKH